MQTIIVLLQVGILLLLLALTAGIILTGTYHLFVLRVPFVPTPRRIARRMVELAELKGTERVFDLGAGTGTILYEAKKRHPGITAIGYEVVPTVWMLGKALLWVARSDVDLRMRDAFTADLHEADVVFLYLTSQMLGRLVSKFDAELRPGTLVISHAFRFPDRSPIHEETLPWGRSITRIRVYRW